MNYTNYDEVILRYPMLSKYVETESQMNSSFIYFAEVELNGRLASKFTVPFSDTPPTIKDLAIDLTYYRCIRIREPEEAKLIHGSIIGRIDDIMAGREYLYTESGAIYPQGGGGDVWSTTMDHHPVHSMHDAESAFSLVSSERLYQEEADRE